MTDYDKAYWIADKIVALGDYAKEAAMILRKQADELATLKQQGEPVFIVFDGSPGPDSPRFIEVETADGRSTFVDGWHEYPKDIAMHLGMWRLGPLYTSAPTIPEGWQLVQKPDETGQGRLIVDGKYYGLPMSVIDWLAAAPKEKTE